MDVYKVQAFTHNGEGGNPAGVVLNADALTVAQKQAIAAKVGFSETAFVSQSKVADFNVSFFTPNAEVDFCGHATLATFWLMYYLQKIEAGRFQQETKAGLLGVDISPDGRVLMSQNLPVWSNEFKADLVAPMLGISADCIEQTGLPIQALSTGLIDLIVPVPYGVLDNLKVDFSAMTSFCQQHQLIGLHVFELNPDDSAYTASCRNFAPAVGIPEESATGSASGALACYLQRYLGLEKMIFEQGKAMQLASRITANLVVGESIEQVIVGGEAVLSDVLQVKIA